jgi:hypothetical protein
MTDNDCVPVVEPDAVLPADQWRGGPSVDRESRMAPSIGFTGIVPILMGSILGGACGAILGGILGFFAGPVGSLAGVLFGAFAGMVLGAALAQFVWTLIALPIRIVLTGAACLLISNFLCVRFFHFSLFDRISLFFK